MSIENIDKIKSTEVVSKTEITETEQEPKTSEGNEKAGNAVISDKLKLIKTKLDEKMWHELSIKITELISSSHSVDNSSEASMKSLNVNSKVDVIKFGRTLHSHLNEKYGEGWNIILGSNYFGICSFTNDNYAEFSVEEVRFMIFKSSP